MKKCISLLAIGFGVFMAGPVWAHVSVSPDTIQAAESKVFTVSVPNEKDVAVTGLRLTIPAGVEEVIPNAKAGWTVTVKKDANQNVTEISWTGGTILTDLRDEFLFKAQAPAEQTELAWKAYQTYQDGSVVSWDQDPSHARGDDQESETNGPYSVTAVTNGTIGQRIDPAPSEDRSKQALDIAYTALGLAVIGFVFGLRKK